MWRTHATRSERGQASPEWIGLTLLLALLLIGALAALGPLSLGVSLGRALGAKLICAVQLSNSCLSDSDLVDAYGPDLADAVRDHAPEVLYERGMRALPVDYRGCRSASCADGAAGGRVWRSASGEPATAFVHVVDCRPGQWAAANCSGPRAGSVYLQYWFFYPDSATLRGVPVAGKRGYHRDDWETYQVRIGPAGDADVRASSHRGYNYGQGAANWGSEAGIVPLNVGAEALGARKRNGWGPETGALFVSGGSHAGNVRGDPSGVTRVTPGQRIRLVPLEPIADRDGAPAFAVSAPWAKAVWSDPEAEGTS